VEWLVLHHLDMSTIAQSRDLSDPKTSRDFASIVETAERLKLLLILTIADIRAVGPATWNGWKGQLLRTLYHETLPLVEGRRKSVTGSEAVAASADRIAAAKQALSRKATNVGPAVLSAFIDRQYDDYWLRTDTRRQLEHLKLADAADRQQLAFVTDYATDTFTSVTELTVLAPNHPRLLSLFAGACAAAGANIVGAHITTTRDGAALDTFLLRREFDHDEDENRRAQRIGDMMRRLLDGETTLEKLLAGRRKDSRGPLQAFTVEPEVTIDNGISDQFSVVEVAGLDRPGLLYEVTAALSDLSLDITSAHITTFGERAVDAFYVTDLEGAKIVTAERRAAISQALTKVLSGEVVRETS
jgi:[protein-PII] uridylyltransferase